MGGCPARFTTDHNVNQAARRRWRVAIQTVIQLLQLRRNWAAKGRSLANGEAGYEVNIHFSGQQWSEIGQLLKDRNRLFDHVERRHGILRYKAACGNAQAPVVRKRVGH